jgi:hypothetical protein
MAAVPAKPRPGSLWRPWRRDCTYVDCVSVGVAMRAICGALLGLVLAGASGCPGINDAPKVSIKGPKRVFPKQPVTLEAELRDQSKGTPTFQWIVGDMEACPSTLELAARPGSGDTLGVERTATFQDERERDYCVWVIATDSEGARVHATHALTVKRRELVINGPGMVTSNQEISYTASYTDDTAAVVTSRFYWGSGPTCADARGSANEIRGSGQPMPLPGNATWKSPASRNPFCVVVMAVDEFAFTLTAERAYPVANIVGGGPPAAIRVVSPAGEMPFGIFSQVRLAAGAKGDITPTDPLTFVWKLTAPGGTTSVPPPCPEAKPTGAEVCFPVVATGAYQVELTVTEGTQTASAAPFRLEVQDLPPCIRRTQPSFTDAARSFSLYDRELVFTVRDIEDDGDPVPPPDHATEQVFRWSVRKKGQDAFTRAVNATFRSYVIPARDYQPGDEVEVRFEYFDRLNLQTLRTECHDDDALCEAKPGSGCTQRVTWTVVYL